MASQVIGKVRPGQATEYDATKIYSPLDRINLSGEIWECVARTAPGESPATTPGKWIVISAGISGQALAEVEAKADAALPKSGGVLTGALQIGDAEHQAPNMPFKVIRKDIEKDVTPDAAKWSANVFCDKDGNIIAKEQVYLAATGYINHELGIVREVSGANKEFSMGLQVDADGTAKTYGPHGNLSGYSNEFATIKNLKDYAAQTPAATVDLYLGGAGVSDTLDLNAGRGLTPEKPFYTLDAAAAWASTHFSGCGVNINLQADITIDGLSWTCPTLRFLHLVSSGTVNRKITTTGSLVVTAGTLYISNVNFDVNNNTYLLFAQGHIGNPAIFVEGNIVINGTTGTVVSASCNGQIYLPATLTGNVKGKRYHIVDGGKVITNHRGTEIIPGTIAGVCDGNSIYA